MHSLKQFMHLPADAQLDELNRNAVPLDLACCVQRAEAVLFAYNGFYVELLVDKRSDEILALKCFKSLRKLEPYLHQVDISDITALLSFG